MTRIHYEKPLEPRVIAQMDAVVCVGFGCANVCRDAYPVFEETVNMEYSQCWTFQDAENEAAKDPDYDWRVHLIGPLHESHWQRQAPGEWVLYESGDGFA